MCNTPIHFLLFYSKKEKNAILYEDILFHNNGQKNIINIYIIIRGKRRELHLTFDNCIGRYLAADSK